MKALVGANGIKHYTNYMFADISAGFLTSAQVFMSEFCNIKFSILNIEQDLVKQGYEPAYDVVLASQAIHVTASMDRALANCRKLLKLGGKLILWRAPACEFCPTSCMAH